MSECRKHQWYAPSGTYNEVHPPCPWCTIKALHESNHAKEKRITDLETEVANRKEAFEAQWKLHNEHARGWCERIAALEKVAEAAVREYTEQEYEGFACLKTRNDLFYALSAAGYLKK